MLRIQNASLPSTLHDLQADFLVATDEPEWILEHSRREKIRAAREKRKELENRLARIRERGERQRKRANAEANRPLKKQVKAKINAPRKLSCQNANFA